MGMVKIKEHCVISDNRSETKYIGFNNETVFDYKDYVQRRKFYPLDVDYNGSRLKSACLIGDYTVAHLVYRAIYKEQDLDVVYGRFREETKHMDYPWFDAGLVLCHEDGTVNLMLLRPKEPVEFIELKEGDTILSSFEGIQIIPKEEVSPDFTVEDLPQFIELNDPHNVKPYIV